MEIATIETRLAEIEPTQAAIPRRLDDLLSVKTIKDWYSVEEVAERVGRTPYQVREWLRTGRFLGTMQFANQVVAIFAIHREGQGLPRPWREAGARWPD